MNTSPFTKFGFPDRRPGKPNFVKGETGGVGLLPRAATSAVLPWAIIMLPLRGAGQANQPFHESL